MFKAVTSIWCVKDRLDHVVHYVEDEEKTVDEVIDYVNNVSIVIHLIHVNQ